MSNSFTDSYQPRVPLAGRRVLVAMSGGVDSSVAAVLLASAGAEVTGATFKNFCFTEAGELPGRSCCSVEAVADALAVCRAIGIPHTLVDETERFGRNVIDDFDAEYRAGRTPNPCARCNSAVRFPRLLEEASRLGCDYVATGHYARVCMSDDRLFLARGLDGDKDQSYFLAGMDPGSYVRVLFPLGGLRKARTRELAREAGLHVHEKPESQDVCFLAGRSLRDYLGGRGLLRPGPVLGPEGERLGEHPGAGPSPGGARGRGGGGGGGVPSMSPAWTLRAGPSTWATSRRCGQGRLPATRPGCTRLSTIPLRAKRATGSRPRSATAGWGLPWRTFRWRVSGCACVSPSR